VTKIYYPCVHGVTCPVLRPRAIPAPLSLDGARDHGSNDSNRVRPVDPRAIRHRGIQAIPYARALSIIANAETPLFAQRERNRAPMWDYPGCVDAQPIPLNRFRRRAAGPTTAVYLRCVMIPTSGRCCRGGWCSTQMEEFSLVFYSEPAVSWANRVQSLRNRSHKLFWEKTVLDTTILIVATYAQKCIIFSIFLREGRKANESDYSL